MEGNTLCHLGRQLDITIAFSIGDSGGRGKSIALNSKGKGNKWDG